MSGQEAQVIRAQQRGKACRRSCGFVSHAATTRARFASEYRHSRDACRLRPGAKA